MLILWGGIVFLAMRLGEKVPGGFVPEEDQGYFLCAIQLPDVRGQLEATEVIRGTPREFSAYIGNEFENFGRLVKLLGLKPE